MPRSAAVAAVSVAGTAVSVAGTAALLIAGLAGCTAGARPTGGATSLTSAGDDAAQQLAVLASAGAAADYTASYSFSASTGGASAAGTVSVALRGKAEELQVDLGGQLTTFLVNDDGSYSCADKNGAPVCLQVAGPGQPAPAALQPGLERVFRAYLEVLAHPAAGRQIAVAERPAGVADGECFAVSAATSVDSADASGSPAASDGPAQGGGLAAVAAGTYCLAADGVVTAATFPSGSLLLVSRGPAPDAAALASPPAPATPLPSITATATAAGA